MTRQSSDFIHSISSGHDGHSCQVIWKLSGSYAQETFFPFDLCLESTELGHTIIYTGQPGYLKSPKEWRKYFELSKVRHKQNVTSPQYDVHVQFLQDILLQYTCSKTVTTGNRIEMKTKEILLSLFYLDFNYIVDRHNATALARDKYCRNSDFSLNYWLWIRKWWKSALVIEFTFFSQTNRKN